MAQNRTKWPITGGALSFQPGWFAGHKSAFIYINIGLGTEPLNYSHPMVPVFQMTGPTNDMYPGTFCLPQIPLPANISYNIGDNATIQVIETAVHGAALYSVSSIAPAGIFKVRTNCIVQCVDITFADPHDVAEVNKTNCYNSSGGDQGGPMGFNFVYTATGQTSGSTIVTTSWVVMLSTVSAALYLCL